MNRDFRRLKEGSFDVLVVGGGIYGAWIAYDASLRGLRVALVEKTDWAAGTSSASSKLIHGGLRYLAYGRFGMVRRALAERRRLWRLGPHRVRPLRFLMPVYARGGAGRSQLRLGLWIYDRLGASDPPGGTHGFLPPAEVRRDYPFLAREGLRGGFTFGDCSTDDVRFTLEIVDGALAAGTAAVNRARAIRLLRSGGRVAGAIVQDGETGGTAEVRARVTVNCTGPWSGELLDGCGPGAGPPIRRTKGVHLILPRLPTREALLLPLEERGRVLFLIPWNGRTLLGTTDTDFSGEPDRVAVEPEEAAFLLGRANRILEVPAWRESDILGSFAGVRTLPASRNPFPAAVSREFRLDETPGGLITPIGGKYTSARADAAKVVDRILVRLGRPAVLCPTEDRPFPWRPPEDVETWAREAARIGMGIGLDPETAAEIPLRYGTGLEQVLALIRAEPRLAERIVPEASFCLAETAHAARREMARTLEDVLVRRIPLLRITRPPRTTLLLVAAVVGSVLGWTEERREQEVAAVSSGRPPGKAKNGEI